MAVVINRSGDELSVNVDHVVNEIIVAADTALYAPPGGSGGTATWESIVNKPVYIAAAATKADARAIIGAGTSDLAIGPGPNSAAAGNHNHDDTYAAVSHVHPAYATNSALTSGLAGKSDTGHNHDGTYAKPSDIPTWATISGKPTTFAPIIGTTASTAKAGNYTPSVADIPSLPASKITSGVIPPARLGTGTADGTTYLAGDGVFRTPPGGGGSESADWATITNKPTVIAAGSSQAAARAVIGAIASSDIPAAPTWGNISGKPAVIAEGSTAAAARAAIGAGTSSVIIGTGAANAAAGNHNHDTSYAAIDHGHTEYATNTALTSGLNAKSNTGHDHDGVYAKPSDLPTWSTLSGKPATFAPVIGTTASTAKAGNYAPPTATEAIQGVIEIATAAETATGTDTARAVTPAAIKPLLDAKSNFSGVYSDLTGKPTLGTAASTNATAYATSAQGTKADSAVQPAALTSGLAGKANAVHNHDSAYRPIAWKPGLADIPAGSIVAVKHTGSTWPSRPTPRTDITVHWIGSTQSNPPPGAIPGDLHDYQAGL